jgi:hypothetical protein
MNKDYSDVDTSKFSIQFTKQGMLSSPDIYIYGRNPLSADSLTYKDSVNNQTLMFTNSDIHVTYQKENETAEYIKSQGYSRKSGHQSSIFFFRNKTPIVVFPNGMYFQPLDIMFEGYWAFEKLAELLPSDYGVK